MSERTEQLVSWTEHLTYEVLNAKVKCERLRQAILAKAFSGQLVPQDPNDEPASVLLERTRAQRGTPSKQAGRRRRAATQEELALQS